MKNYSIILFCGLLYCAAASTAVSRLINSANPFAKTPSDLVSFLPGFTEENVLVVAVGSDLEEGAFAPVSYQKARTLAECKAQWGVFVKNATRSPEGGFYADYLALRQNTRTEDKDLEAVAFVRKLEKALRRMLHHPNNFGGFYNAKRVYRLKLSLAQALDLVLKKDPEYKALWLPVLQKMGMDVLAYENAVRDLGMLNYNSLWEKRKETTTTAIAPLSKATKAISKLGAVLDPFTTGLEPLKSKALVDFFEQKHTKLQLKLKQLLTSLKQKKGQKKPSAWVETVSNDPETFSRPGRSLIPLFPDETVLHRAPSRGTPEPFGRICSAPSPIPGISWRRLAELCTSGNQSLHAQDFGSVVDWTSFFHYMMQDKEAANYQESLFARFLKIYAPETFLNVFSKKGFKGSDQTDFVLKEIVEKTHYDLIMGIILGLEQPHTAFKRFSIRTALTKLEAKLLRLLLDQYKDPKRDALVQFPSVVYSLKNPRLPQKLKYAPDNLGLRFNSSNVALYKAVVNIIKLNFLEISSDSINLHSGWGTADAITKVPWYIATAPLTVPVRLLGKGVSTTQSRTVRTASAVAPKRKQLTIKVNEALRALQKAPITKTYRKHISLEKTPYAAYRQKPVREPSILQTEAVPLPPSSTPHEPTKPVRLGAKKGIQAVYPIRVPAGPAAPGLPFDEQETGMEAGSGGA